MYYSFTPIPTGVQPDQRHHEDRPVHQERTAAGPRPVLRRGVGQAGNDRAGR